MTERYDVAAWRHLTTAQSLMTSSNIDDAGYHLGISAETCLKHAITVIGLAPNLHSLNQQNPMRAHIPRIGPLLVNAKALIVASASGRAAAPLIAVISRPGFTNMFSGWSIDIRYADSTLCPVAAASVSAWQQDAEQLLMDLMI